MQRLVETAGPSRESSQGVAAGTANGQRRGRRAKRGHRSPSVPRAGARIRNRPRIPRPSTAIPKRAADPSRTCTTKCAAHTPRAGKIRVVAQSSAPTTSFRVSDTGSGIRPNTSPAFRAILSRDRRPAKKAGPGFGWDLKHLVEAHADAWRPKAARSRTAILLHFHRRGSGLVTQA